ncbi:MAG: prolipoprotein diacylglyceryl transferase [Waddliaceae bacterium]
MYLYSLLAWLHWDPPRFAFTLPYLNHSVAWYGICFAFGFMLGFLIVIPIFKRKLEQTNKILERDISNWSFLITHLRKAIGFKENPISPIFKKLGKEAQESIGKLQFKQEPDKFLKQEIIQALNASLSDRKLRYSRETLEGLFPKVIYKLQELALYLTDRMTWFIVLGTIVGARLGHVFFYEWPRYQKNPIDIIKVWEGGLASHGAALGIMLAIFLYQRMICKRFPEFTFVDLLDILCIPASIAAVWIRIGNFINQEIVGPVTTVPWAIVFGNPVEGRGALPRHPSQLYEAAIYLLTFCVLYFLWKKKSAILKPGTLTGLFMIFVFGSRFLVEFVKNSHSLMIDESFLHAGQYLSLPFILLGCALLFYSRRHKSSA